MLNRKAFLPLVLALLCAACAKDGLVEGKGGGRAANADPYARQLIEQQFSNAPVMVRIAACESGLRQFDRSGSVLRGAQHHPDSGVFQINKSAHSKKAQALGIDLDTTEGNVAYARHLYDTEGTAPWISSKGCWGRYRTATQ